MLINGNFGGECCYSKLDGCCRKFVHTHRKCVQHALELAMCMGPRGNDYLEEGMESDAGRTGPWRENTTS